jgi:hypothetical protein
MLCPYEFKARLIHYVGDVAFVAAAMEIVHGNVEIGLAAGGFDGDDHGFGVLAAGKAFFVHVHFGREDFEAKALVVKKSYGIADHHVG